MTNWLLNTVGLLATTIAVLLMFLHAHKTARASADAASSEANPGAAKRGRLAMVALGLLAVWFVIQYAAVILL